MFDGDLSEDHSVWGDFGDYIGGVLSPIFSLINIGVLIYLTTLVSKQDDRRSLDKFRFKALKKFSEELIEYNVFNKNYSGMLSWPLHLKNYINNFRMHNLLFFNHLAEKDLIIYEKNISILTEKLDSLIKIVSDKEHEFRDQLRHDSGVLYQLEGKYVPASEIMDLAVRSDWRLLEDEYKKAENILRNTMVDVYSYENLKH